MYDMTIIEHCLLEKHEKQLAKWIEGQSMHRAQIFLPLLIQNKTIMSETLKGKAMTEGN